MPNKEEIIERLNLMQERCCNGYDAEAIYLAVKAIRIVEVIEDGFKRDGNMMDSDDWKDIKELVEKEVNDD